MFEPVGAAVESNEKRVAQGEGQPQLAKTDKSGAAWHGCRKELVQPLPKLRNLVGRAGVTWSRPRQVFPDCMRRGPDPAAKLAAVHPVPTLVFEIF